MRKKRTVSILTFWGVPNYGAFAQAYALNMIIQELFPEYCVEHIGYLSKDHWDYYYSKKRPRFLIKSNPLHLLFYKTIYWSILRIKKYFFEPKRSYTYFHEAWAKIPNVPVVSAEQLEGKKWDMVVTGSDCIWQFSTEAFGNDYHLIGKNIQANRVVAYACSFGNQDNHIPVCVPDQLIKYDYLSVRDSFSERIVKENTMGKCRPELVLDPTLIYNFKADRNVKYYDSNGEKYILVYGDVFPKEMVSEIRLYAKENGIKTIGVGKAPKWCDEIIRETDPFKWIGMFQGAEFVFTNTFHGMMFCLIYNKKFYFQQEEYVKNRSSYILELLGLDKLFLTGDFCIKKMLDYNWDYRSINAIIEKKREESIRYLTKALS